MSFFLNNFFQTIFQGRINGRPNLTVEQEVLAADTTSTEGGNCFWISPNALCTFLDLNKNVLLLYRDPLLDRPQIQPFLESKVKHGVRLDSASHTNTHTHMQRGAGLLGPPVLTCEFEEVVMSLYVTEKFVISRKINGLYIFK